MLKIRGNMNYLGILIQEYVNQVNIGSLPPEERIKMERHILIELFGVYGFTYSSDGEISSF